MFIRDSNSNAQQAKKERELANIEQWLSCLSGPQVSHSSVTAFDRLSANELLNSLI
jgi:hypothetical protein